jgi:hypothetical protein
MQWRLALIRSCCTGIYTAAVNVPLGTVEGDTIIYNGFCEEIYAIAGGPVGGYPYYTIDYIDCPTCENENPCPTPTPTVTVTNTNTVTPSVTKTVTPTDTPGGTPNVTPTNTTTVTVTNTNTPSSTNAAPITGSTTLTPDGDNFVSNVTIVGRGIATIAAALADSFDGTYGRTVASVTSQYTCTLTNGSVPAGSTIDSIVVQLRHSGDGGLQPVSQTCTVRLYKTTTLLDSDTFTADYISTTIIDSDFTMSAASVSDTDVADLRVNLLMQQPRGATVGNYRYIKMSVIVYYTEP